MNSSPRTLADLAQLLGAELRGDGGAEVTGVATLKNAGPGQIAFLANEKYARDLVGTGATVVLVRPDLAGQCPTNALVLENPYLGFARVSHLFDSEPTAESGIHSSATVAAGAVVAETASVASCAVIESEARIGGGVRVGDGTVLAANVTLYHDVVVGDRCRISGGAVIGADGFGYAHAGDHWERIAQTGGVRIGDDVDIGANTSIDRGALDDTVIDNGVKIDNNVQIGHNVRIGAHSAIAAMVGISGSTHVGCHCIFGGASGVGGHLTIADNVHLTGMTMVTKSLHEPGLYSSGTGVEKNRQWRRSVVRFRQLDEMARRLRQLEKKLNK